MKFLERELYDIFLKEINKVRFTPREIDVISCIVHNRGEKKIASILAISPSTVNSHACNVTNKIGSNSRESIIDFIENSGKLKYIKKYYFYLLVNKTVKAHLKKIGTTINPKKIICAIVTEDVYGIFEHKQILEIFNKYLTLTNIFLVKENSDSIDFKINIVTSNSILLENTINLIFDDINVDKDDKFQCVDFRDSENLHVAIFELIAQILGKTKITAISDACKNEIKSLANSLENSDITQNIPRYEQKYFSKKSIIIATIFVFLTLGVFLYTKIIPNILNSHKIIDQSVQNELDQMFLAIQKYGLSTNNTTNTRLHGNYTIIKQFDKVDTTYSEQDLQNYFVMPENSKKLVAYLYAMHASGVYVQYKEYDHAKSSKILIKAKNVAENYINKMNKISINFDKLAPQELLDEIDVVEELPQMYTKILYNLGKAYMLQGDFSNAVNYYTKSAYLGDKLGLFEGYLSKYKGLMEIEQSNIQLDINIGNFKIAKDKLLELLKLYQEVKVSDKSYKFNYIPFKKPEIILLEHNMESMLDCGTKLVAIYSMLISITKDDGIKQHYANSILTAITGDDSYRGILHFIDKVPKLKKAGTLNSLANILFELLDNKIILEPIKIVLQDYFQLYKMNDLDFIEELFQLARANSKINDYNKMASLDGLIKVLTAKINSQNLKNEQKDTLLNSISLLETKKRLHKKAFSNS